MQSMCEEWGGGDEVGEYFKVGRELREKSVISLWLFNFFLDRVIKQVNEVKLKHKNGRGWGNNDEVQMILLMHN